MDVKKGTWDPRKKSLSLFPFYRHHGVGLFLNASYGYKKVVP